MDASPEHSERTWADWVKLIIEDDDAQRILRVGMAAR
jgi:hypothetical protein